MKTKQMCFAIALLCYGTSSVLAQGQGGESPAVRAARLAAEAAQAAATAARTGADEALRAYRAAEVALNDAQRALGRPPTLVEQACINAATGRARRLLGLAGQEINAAEPARGRGIQHMGNAPRQPDDIGKIVEYTNAKTNFVGAATRYENAANYFNLAASALRDAMGCIGPRPADPEVPLPPQEPDGDGGDGEPPSSGDPGGGLQIG